MKTRQRQRILRQQVRLSLPPLRGDDVIRRLPETIHYPPYPSSTSTKPYTALAAVPETITGERDSEHLHHRPRDESLCLSQAKHKDCHNMGDFA